MHNPTLIEEAIQQYLDEERKAQPDGSPLLPATRCCSVKRNMVTIANGSRRLAQFAITKDGTLTRML
jgi:hypothetical protein